MHELLSIKRRDIFFFEWMKLRVMKAKFACAVAVLSVWVSLTARAQDTPVHDPAEYLSGTLPVLYVNTKDSVPVTSKEYYLQGSYYLDAEGFDQYESIGSANEPLPLQIKGRGNNTWVSRAKKPYRLKLDKKAALLGMPKSKHWVLMAAASDWRGKGRDYMAFEISRRMGMPWTPGDVPCELVLNGDYKGLYFVVEKIRIAKERVNIFDMEEAAEVAAQNGEEFDDVTGGWLLEIDNYNAPNQLRLPDIDGSTLRVTYQSPESPTPAQKAFIDDLLTRTHNAINTSDKSSREWEQYVDIDAIARFYVIQEVVDNQEAFSGSCWFYKDQGDTAKFIFGPVWDFGSSMSARVNGTVNNFMYENTGDNMHWKYHWIRELVKFPRFQIALRKHWHRYRDQVFPQMQQVATDLATMIEKAGEADYRRWHDGSSLYIRSYLNQYVRALGNKFDFLSRQWDEDYHYPTGDLNLDGLADIADVNLIINVMLGRQDASQCLGDPDVTGDGIVDVEDLNATINSILGKVMAQ